MKAFLLLLFASGAALADDAALLRCRSIADVAARLACYDALAVTQGTNAAIKPETGTGKTPVQPAVSAQAQALPKATQQTQQQIPQQADQFGLEEKIANKTALDAIESTIPGSFEGWSGRTVFRLANGQAWQVADDSARAHYIDNPKVRIRRGALGAFYLEIQGTNHSPRVRRVQ